MAEETIEVVDDEIPALSKIRGRTKETERFSVVVNLETLVANLDEELLRREECLAAGESSRLRSGHR